MARLTWFDRAQKTWFQTYYDDPVTLAPKEQLAVERGLAGIGIWALGDDAGQPGYWETISTTLALGPSPSPSPSMSASPTAEPLAVTHREREHGGCDRLPGRQRLAGCERVERPERATEWRSVAQCRPVDQSVPVARPQPRAERHPVVEPEPIGVRLAAVTIASVLGTNVAATLARRSGRLPTGRAARCRTLRRSLDARTRRPSRIAHRSHDRLSFANLGLSADLLRAVAEEGYTTPTPIQTQAIPLDPRGPRPPRGRPDRHRQDRGLRPARSSSGCASTPTRASARPAIPVRVLVLTPTRELCMQVEQMAIDYGRYVPLRVASVFGGVPIEPQLKELRAGVEFLVATPGRLLDHVGQRTVNLGQVEILVLDEADRMLDMGFIPDIRKILALLPSKRQNLLFSATFNDEVRSLSSTFMSHPATVEVAPRNTTLEAIRQIVYPVDRDRKEALLAHLIRRDDLRQVLVFTRTKIMASRLAARLDREGIEAVAIHSDRTQPERTRALEAFKNGELRVLVATDVAARGLDIEDLPHVVNFELPPHPQDYIHRIGRTGRAGATGDAISLVSLDEAEYLRGDPAPAAQGDPVAGRGGLRAPSRPRGPARAGPRAARRERQQRQPRWRVAPAAAAVAATARVAPRAEPPRAADARAATAFSAGRAATSS